MSLIFNLESEIEYEKYTYGYQNIVKPKLQYQEHYYDLGDEIGRGTQGVVYHTVERATGKSFASKMMHGRDKLREYMSNELNIMNNIGYHPRILRLWDAFAPTPHSLSLITDFCGGGELLDNILHKGTLTESEVAHYTRQILDGLEYLHMRSIGHFGLTVCSFEIQIKYHFYSFQIILFNSSFDDFNIF